MFPNFQGEVWTESDWRAWGGRRFRPALAEAGVAGRVRPYDCRHSNASMLIASGLNIVEVARRMGHSPNMCLSTYAHVFDEYEGRRIDLDSEIAEARSSSV